MISQRSRGFWLASILLIAARCEQENVGVSPVPAVLKPAFYGSAAIRARVVHDGKPVPDAVVLAVWRSVDDYTLHWRFPYRYTEVISDENGVFVIPRWGPRPPENQTHLDSRDPELWILREGCRLLYADNTGAYDLGNPRVPPHIKAPPALFAPEKRSKLVRDDTGSSIWAGQELSIERAESPEEVVATLKAAAPLDRYTPRRAFPMPLFEARWNAIHARLPPSLRSGVRSPFSDLSATASPETDQP